MTHEEKSKLLELFADGVRLGNREMLKQAKESYDAYHYLDILRERRRDVYQLYKAEQNPGEKQKQKEFLDGLEKIQTQYKRQAEEAYDNGMKASRWGNKKNEEEMEW